MGDLRYGNGVELLCAQVVLHSVIATAVGEFLETFQATSEGQSL